MFTAVAIMQLVEAGKIDLQAPVGRYLTNYPNQDIATKVTVAATEPYRRNGQHFRTRIQPREASLRSTKDYIDLYGNRAAEFAPGSRKSYSNYGFILLGRIVEEVSAFHTTTIYQRNIFKPAGVTWTGNRPETENLPRRAVGYTGSGAKLKSAADTLPSTAPLPAAARPLETSTGSWKA